MSLVSGVSDLASRLATEFNSVRTQLAGKANASHTHVATTDLTATGTKNGTTYLRGDDTWAEPPDGAPIVPVQPNEPIGESEGHLWFDEDEPTDDKISLDALDAAGVMSETTYLRGDGLWATPEGGGAQVFVQPEEPEPEEGETEVEEGTLWFDEDEPVTFEPTADGIWYDWTPIVFAEAGTFGTIVLGTSRYTRIGATVHWNAIIGITAVGTATGGVDIRLPLPLAAPGGNVPVGAGVEAASTGKMLGVFRIDSTRGRIKFYDFSSPIFAGASLQVSGTYEVAP